jgi:hypothetical protein
MADSKISALPAASTPLAGTEVLPIVQGGITEQVSVANLTAGRAVGALSLSVTQGITGGSGFQVSGFTSYRSSGASASSPGDAAIYYNAATGYTLQARAGSSYDWSLINPGNANYIARVPTGTLNFEIAGGNLVMSTSGKGIDFSATPGTGTSELLDDYEEGTWTAVLRGATTAGTYEFVNNSCQYTKVGRLVTLTAFLRLAGSITGGGVGYAQITGLPFEKVTDSWAVGPVSFNGVVFAGIPTVAPITSGNTSTLYFPQLVTAGGSEVDISGFDVGDYLNFTITYITAS